jgi:putative ABC transport system permease protein
MNERLSPQVWLARLAAALGLAALALSTVGLYGVIAYIVGLRSREFAVRLSLGATPGGILRMVLRQALALTAVGVVLGVLVAAGIGPFVQEEGLPAFNLKAVAGPLALSLASILLASAAPAIRAARVNPIVILKLE